MNAPTHTDSEPGLTDGVHEPPARVVANSAWSMLAQGVGALVGGGVSIYAVRTFSTVSWGHYSTALAFVALFSVLSGAGFGPLALRELTTAPERQAELLGAILRALGLTSVVAAAAMLAVTPAFGYPQQVLVLILVLTPLLALNPALTLLGAACNARARLDYAAVFQLAQSLVYGALAVLVVAGARGVTGLAFATLVATACAFALGLGIVRRKLHLRPTVRQPFRQSLRLLRAAIPIGGIDLVGVVYARVDILMLSVLATATSVAHYAVPYGFVRLSWLVPSVVSAAFFPLLSRRVCDRSPEAEHLFFLVVRVFLFLSLPISLLLALTSPVLLPFVFGGRYAASAIVLQIMAWTSVFGFQNYILWYGMLASHQERAALGVQAAGLVVNVGVNAFAIPLWGPSGAAAALVASDLVVAAGQAVLIHRNLFRVPVGELLAKPLFVGIVVIPFAVLVASWNAVGGAALGAAAYVVALLALRYVSPAEWEPVLSLLRHPIKVAAGAGTRST